MSGATGLLQSRPGNPGCPCSECCLARPVYAHRARTCEKRGARRAAARMSSFPKRGPSQWCGPAKATLCHLAHVTRLRQKQAAEHARKKAEKERKDAEVAKAREVMAMKKTHKKMTRQEKEARKSKVILLKTLHITTMNFQVEPPSRAYTIVGGS